jgi:Tfp pilus assembly protein PilO
MIRINLLGGAKPKGKKNVAVSMPSFEVGNLGGPLVQVAAVLLIAGALNAGYWYTLDREKKSIEVQSRLAEQKNRELADIKVRYMERQKQAEAYKRRVDVIDQLRNNQTGPVNLLSMIADTVNGTEAVWLNSMQDQGANVAIDGTALSQRCRGQPDFQPAEDRVLPQHRDQGKFSGRADQGHAGVSVHADLRKGEVVKAEPTMNLGELTGVKLLGVLLLVAVVGTGGLYYTVYKSQRDQNDAARVKLQAKLRENAELEAYRPKLADIERQLASLKQQLEIERRIVPDEKEVDNFMRMVSGEARKAGVEIRRYTARPYGTKEFYTEVPFEVEFDGPYYSMLGFFDRLGKVERIVNVSNLRWPRPASRAMPRRSIPTSTRPSESVVATCLTTTYFSHDLDPAAAPASKPGPPAKK